LHDRGDYKAGWQLDRDWNERQKNKDGTGQARLTDDKAVAPRAHMRTHTYIAMQTCRHVPTSLKHRAGLPHALCRLLCTDPNKYVIPDADEEDVPFACLICRQNFRTPIVTRCKHYFCEQCALDHYRRSPKCFVCGEKTGGIFTMAKDLLRKLEERRKRAETEAPAPAADDAGAETATPATPVAPS
jgi:RING finger protein 113A